MSLTAEERAELDALTARVAELEADAAARKTGIVTLGAEQAEAQAQANTMLLQLNTAPRLAPIGAPAVTSMFGRLPPQVGDPIVPPPAPPASTEPPPMPPSPQEVKASTST